MYGLDGQEVLDEGIDDIMEQVFVDYSVTFKETDAEIAELIEWPIVVYEYKRQELPESKQMADNILKELYERLNDQYQIEDYEIAPPIVILAARHLANLVRATYHVYSCKRTGRKMTITKDIGTGPDRLDFVPDEETT